MSLSHRLEKQEVAYAEDERLRDIEKQSRMAEGALGSNRNLLVRGIRARIARNQDARIIIVGQGGVGKSTLALSMGEILNPQLYVDNVQLAVDKAVSFSALQFMDSTTLPNKSLLEFDEPGQGWYHRQFMSQASQVLAQTFIGNRFQQFISVLTLPSLSFLDADAIRMSHYLITVHAQGWAQVYEALWQKFGGDVRWHSIINSMPFWKPDIKLWHPYEKKKIAFQTALYAKFRKALEAGEAPNLNNSEIVSMIMMDPERYMKEIAGKKTLHHALIQSEFGIGVNRAYVVKQMAATKIAGQTPLSTS